MTNYLVPAVMLAAFLAPIFSIINQLWIMALDYETLEELAMGRVSDLVDQLVHHQANGDEVMMAIVHQEIKDITTAMDSDDSADHFFYVKDYRYLND